MRERELLIGHENVLQRKIPFYILYVLGMMKRFSFLFLSKNRENVSFFLNYSKLQT